MRTLNVKRFLTFEFIYEFVELLLFCSFFGICRFCFVLCIFMQEPSAVNWYEFSGILGISFCILWVVINIILFVPSLSILIVDVGFPNLEYAVNLVHSWAGNSVADSCIAYRKGDKMFSGHWSSFKGLWALCATRKMQFDRDDESFAWYTNHTYVKPNLMVNLLHICLKPSYVSKHAYSLIQMIKYVLVGTAGEAAWGWCC